MLIERIIAEGDSRTQAANLIGYTALLSRTTGLFIDNMANGGEELINMDGTQYAAQVAPLYDPTKCTLAISAGGINDFWLGGKSSDVVYGYQRSWCAKARPTGLLIAVATIPPAAVGVSGWTSTHESNRIAYNTKLRSTFSSFADFLLDLDSLAVFSNPLDTTYYNSDGLHWKQPAYDAIAPYVKTVLGLGNAGVWSGVRPDPANKSADITISGDGRTIFKNSVASFVSCRSTQSNSGGVKTFEVLVECIGTGSPVGSIMVGVGNSSVATSSYAGANANGASWWSFNDSWLGGGGGTPGVGSLQNGDRLQVEHDTSAQTLRVRKRRYATWGSWSPTNSLSGLNAGPYYAWIMLDLLAQVSVDYTGFN